MTRSNVLHTLAAAAALALTGAVQAQAPASYTMYGLFDLSLGSTKAPGATSSVKGVDSGQMTTSFLGFRGQEDLGGGMAAVFRLEHFIRNDTGAAGRFNGDGFWARNSTVGLTQNGFGTVTFGRNTTPLFVQTLLNNAFGDSFGYSPAIRHYFTSGTTTGDTGWNDSVLYLSPRVNGFGFGAIASLGEGSNGRNFGLNASYGAGPASVAFAWQDVKKDSGGPTNDTKTWQLAGSYDIGVAKLFAQIGNVDNSTTNRDYRITGLGARAPLGQNAVLLQYGRISPNTGASRTTFSAGYQYYLSKRTDLYAVWMRDKVSGLTAGGGYSAGIRHNF